MDKVRIGIAGTSEWAGMMHLKSLASHPRAVLSALCGRDRIRAAKLGAQYNVAKVYTDYYAMLADVPLDAVVICVPNVLHYPFALAALKKGLHVFCEKPLAVSAQEARELLQWADRQKVMHMVNFTYRYLPVFRYMRTLIGEGSIGRVYHASLKYLSNYGMNADYQWRFDRSQAGCGVLADLGSHLIDLAIWFLGDVEKATGRQETFYKRAGCDADDWALLICNHQSGCISQLEVSAVAQLDTKEAELVEVAVYGESGYLHCIFDWFKTVNISGNVEGVLQTLPVPESYIPVTGYNNPEECLAQIITTTSAAGRGFVDSIISGNCHFPGFEDGLKVQEIIDAVAAGAKNCPGA